ncbi:Ig-like domain-containing protein [Halosimplex aquaticum]|uniref:Ig-like domain-containing protein n=1 Tax=Halosimplex aquaticum TaxID=3026162 RepID=A0ABD5YCL8_9EURY|nr:Ig-like domain-containing protein [Halosimplex aquaticum]
MELWDDRGQSIQIGAVLVFAAVVLLLSLYQATVVPQQNERVEFDHSQQIRGELLDLRNAVVSTVGDSAQRSVSVTLGTTYPTRVLAVNPPPASGQLRTVGTADGDVSLGVTNATALDDETDDFWDGRRRDYDTGGIVYRPNYNEYGQPPSTIYENSVLYDEFAAEGTTVARSGQALIDGRSISLVALNGSLSESSSGTRSVDVRPASASSRTVAVRNASPGSNVTVRVPTRLSESRWEGLLADEFVAAGGNVTDVWTNPLPAAPGYRMLVVDLVPGTYDLRMAKAGVGTRVTGTDAAYVTAPSGANATVPEDGSQRLVVEVRDAYNNPVAGVEVTGSADVGALASRTATTGENGRATFRYDAPSVTAATEASVNVSYAVDPGLATAFDGRRPENAELTVTVQNTKVDGPSGGGGGGPAPYSVAWDSPTVSEGGTHLDDCDAADCTWDVGADGDGALDLSAAVADAIGGVDKSTVEGAAVDFALNDSSVGTLSAESAVSDANGGVEAVLRANENGTVRVYAVSGGASDVINVTVANVTAGSGGGGPSVAFRVDDFSDRNQNAPNFVASYDVRGAGDSFERVEVTFAADGGPSGTRQSTAARGSVSYRPGYADGQQFEVTADVIYTDDQGNEYVAASETITDTADARNPVGENDDLGDAGSASLTSYAVSDRSNVNANQVRYRFDYTVSASGSFDRVRLFVLNLNRDGATGLRDETARSGKNVDVEPGFGANAQYRVGFAVYDADGVIVEVVDTTDVADGDGTVLTATLLLLGFGVVGHALRRSSMR